MQRPALPRRIRSERGTALLEMAMTLPLLLLVSVAIFELGRAYQTQQILTNAVREGARMATLPDASPANIQTRVKGYLQMGQLTNVSAATVNVTTTGSIPMGAGTVSTSVVTVNYPFQFTVLGPVMRFVSPKSKTGGALTLTASSQMRNETQF